MARGLHGIGNPLVWIYWRLVELLLYVQFRLGARIANGQNLVPSKPVDIDCFGESTMVPRPGFYELIRQGRVIAHRTEIANFTRDGVVLRDGDALTVDCVVFGTGWKSDYGYLPDEAVEALGISAARAARACCCTCYTITMSCCATSAPIHCASAAS